MATGLRSWSTTASSNASADSNINFAEGQAPSSINDSARALMASAAKWREDNNGTITTGGTSTAYTATSNQGLALTSGVTITLKMNAANGATPTLNVDSLGAKSIQTVSGTAVGTGVLKLNGVYTFVYLSSPDAWVVLGAPAVEFASTTAIIFYQDSAPTGWTITNLNDYDLRLVSGSGNSGGTGGTTGGSTAYSTIFAARTLVAANLPNVTLTVTDPGHTHPYQTHIGNDQTASGSGAIRADNQTGSTTSSATTGISVAIDNTARGGAQTTIDFAVRYANVIIASKN